MRTVAVRIKPDDYILAVLSPKDRLDAAFRVAGEAFKKAFSDGDICVSPAILTEYRNVPIELEAKGKLTHSQFKALIAGIAAVVATARMVYPTKEVRLCWDPKDNMLLECCLEAGANFRISCE